MLGISSVAMIFTAVIRPPIHSIVVVTSPIGEKAPPALAATTIIPAKNNLICLFGTSFLMRDTITMEVVRLSSMADNIKVTPQIIHSSFFGFLVLIRSVTTRKPWKASTSSTIVIAPNKKNKMAEISPRCSASCSPMWWILSGEDTAYKVQQITPVRRAVAVLLILIGCSRAIAMYPSTKMRMIAISIYRN